MTEKEELKQVTIRLTAAEIATAAYLGALSVRTLSQQIRWMIQQGLKTECGPGQNPLDQHTAHEDHLAK
jgi:hypothetical protein